MSKFTLQGLRFLQGRRRGNRFAISFKTILTLLLVNFFSSDLLAQVPSIDGSPAEWPGILNNANNTIKGFKHDPFNVNGIDDQWTGGSQDNDASPSANWHWVLGNSNDKGDIGNAGAVLLGTILYFFGDRSSFNGDAQIGFWFFKDNVQPTGAGDRSSPFSGEHTNGDLLIISNFTNGGGTGAPTIYEWKNKTSNSAGGLVQIPLNTAPASLTTNASSVASPNNTLMFNNQRWLFNAKGADTSDHDYKTNLFFEGFVDLANIPDAACFQRFLLETRNSQSIGASLQDFTAGNFNGTPPAPGTTGGSRCGTGTVNLSASGCTGGTLKWYNAATGGSVVNTGTSFTTPSLSATTSYYVSCTTTQGCEGPRTQVTATIKPIPPISLKITQPDLCTNSTGSLQVCSPSTGFTYSDGTTSKTPTAGQSVIFTGLAAGSNPTISVTGTNGCTNSATCSSASTTACSTPGAASTTQVAPTQINVLLPEEESKVVAAPNPFNDKIRFSIQSAATGQGSLELYNMLGQRVKVVYQGNFQKGQIQTIEYNVPGSQRANLIYVFRVGNQKTSGKLIGLK